MCISLVPLFQFFLKLPPLSLSQTREWESGCWFGNCSFFCKGGGERISKSTDGTKILPPAGEQH